MEGNRCPAGDRVLLLPAPALSLPDHSTSEGAGSPSGGGPEGGVADHPGRAPLLGLLVDQRAGVVAVVLVSGRERDRGQKRRLGVGRRVDLVFRALRCLERDTTTCLGGLPVFDGPASPSVAVVRPLRRP
jgi:hypothetical protein